MKLFAFVALTDAMRLAERLPVLFLLWSHYAGAGAKRADVFESRQDRRSNKVRPVGNALKGVVKGRIDFESYDIRFLVHCEFPAIS